MRILFVCLGNICRSPSAEGVFRHKVKAAGLSDAIGCDSAGTAGYHTGAKADKRMISHAEKRGIQLESRARQFVTGDFDEFDLILVMDESNYQDVQTAARSAGLESVFDSKVKMMMEYADSNTYDKYPEVPDPYYGGSEGFELVLDLLDISCENLLNIVRKDIGE